MTDNAYPVPDHDDLRRVVDQVVDAFGALPDDAWDVRAYGLEWSCRDTAAHLLDDFSAYAMQLSGRRPPLDTYVPVAEPPPWREGSPPIWFWPEPETGSAGMAQCADALGGLLGAVVQVVPPDRRGWHPAGVSDASGFAAIGIVEAVLHAYDVLVTHGRPFRGDDRAVERSLNRLFPRVVPSGDPWADLLVAGGRTPDTRDRPWNWDSTVRDTYGPTQAPS